MPSHALSLITVEYFSTSFPAQVRQASMASMTWKSVSFDVMLTGRCLNNSEDSLSCVSEGTLTLHLISIPIVTDIIKLISVLNFPIWSTLSTIGSKHHFPRSVDLKSCLSPVREKDCAGHSRKEVVGEWEVVGGWEVVSEVRWNFKGMLTLRADRL